MELRNNCEHIESMVALLSELKTQILNFLWVSIIFDGYLIFTKLCKIKIMIFKLKMFFYKTNVINLFLKRFLNNWDFIKVILKPDFADWHVLKKNCFDAARPVLDTLSNVYELHGALDTGWCRIPHCR